MRKGPGSVYDKWNISVVIYSNIPAAPAYGVCIYQMIPISRACDSYQDFLDRELLLTR
jgi:hypothetical protein